jgi:hypothetical protein
MRLRLPRGLQVTTMKNPSTCPIDTKRFSPWKRRVSSRSSTGLSNIRAARTKSTP